MLPNFFIIGAQKAGTTFLNNHLAQHPNVYMPKDKEIPYFYDERFFARGIEAYRWYFRDWDGERLVGNAPVNLLYLSNITAKRIYEYDKKGIKLVCSLRNPIERAYSAYLYFRRNLWERSVTFEHALKRESWVKKYGSLAQKCNLTYIDHGFYKQQLTEFYRYFDKRQLLIIFFEDIKNNPKKILERVSEFLEIETIGLPNNIKKSNVASRPRFITLSKLIYTDNKVKKFYAGLIPYWVRYKIRYFILTRITEFNNKPFEKVPIKPYTRQKLQKIFDVPNRQLEDLLKVDLSSWR